MTILEKEALRAGLRFIEIVEQGKDGASVSSSESIPQSSSFTRNLWCQGNAGAGALGGALWHPAEGALAANTRGENISLRTAGNVHGN